MSFSKYAFLPPSNTSLSQMPESVQCSSMKEDRSSFGGPAKGLGSVTTTALSLITLISTSTTEKAHKVPENSSTVNFARPSSMVSANAAAA